MSLFRVNIVKRFIKLDNFRSVIKLQGRCGSYKKSPAVSDDPTKYTNCEIVYNPNEWKFVERLLPIKWIPKPEPKTSYYSGWRPQTANPQDHAYFIERTKNHMLPVYLKVTERGTCRITTVRKVEGDIWKLSEELVEYLKPLMNYTSIGARVDEYKKTIFFRGDFVEHTKKYLSDKGF